jgi:hypothetical protein
MSSPDKPVLKVAPCSHEAAKYAVENWHYSKCMPGAKKVLLIGVWEDEKYIGVVIFSPGATASLGSPYGLNQFQCTELVRIALNRHRTPVSKIVRIALMFLKKTSPGIKLVVSFADPYRNHIGAVYQAGNWIYTGESAATKVWEVDNRIIHPRTLGASDFKKGRKKQLPTGAKSVIMPGKHRYLYPLDEAMKRKVEPLRKPYPKRAGSSLVEHSESIGEEGGSIPTAALKETANEQP